METDTWRQTHGDRHRHRDREQKTCTRNNILVELHSSAVPSHQTVHLSEQLYDFGHRQMNFCHLKPHPINIRQTIFSQSPTSWNDTHQANTTYINNRLTLCPYQLQLLPYNSLIPLSLQPFYSSAMPLCSSSTGIPLSMVHQD